MKTALLLAVLAVAIAYFGGGAHAKDFYPVKPSCRTVCTTDDNGNTVCVTTCNR